MFRAFFLKKHRKSVALKKREVKNSMTDRDFMARAIELAKKGIGAVNPNPLVGAVIVKNGRIIGEGFHERYGELHAERNALKNLTESAEGATMYVTLEPCCHHGRQPPCTDAIIENGISRVVIGSRDPNPLVSGKGARILREKGITVEEDFMREECDALNSVFFHYITTKTPYVAAKYAMTADGKIAAVSGESKWITSEESRNRVQVMRYTFSAIMAGIGTVMTDDPMLNVRIPGKRSPIRIICDSRLRISPDSKIVRTSKEFKTIIACIYTEEDFLKDTAIRKKKEEIEGFGAEVLSVPEKTGHICLKELMRLLGEKNIDSVLIEGGGELNFSAFEEGIVNEAEIFIAPKIFGGRSSKTPVEGDGVMYPSEAFMMELTGTELIGGDILLRYKVLKEEN
jgi:diaminohydroxyphosphoribosylaminopyrimidine deaminase/5-amino-6-(5-phosphoribosylamino)uracil reductase